MILIETRVNNGFKRPDVFLIYNICFRWNEWSVHLFKSVFVIGISIIAVSSKAVFKMSSHDVQGVVTFQLVMPEVTDALLVIGRIVAVSVCFELTQWDAVLRSVFSEGGHGLNTVCNKSFLRRSCGVEGFNKRSTCFRCRSDNINCTSQGIWTIDSSGRSVHDFNAFNLREVNGKVQHVVSGLRIAHGNSVN